MSGIILYILLISFVASLFRSTLGFGESLIAVPLFLLFLPGQIAVPLSVMLSIVIALVIILQDHKHIHFRSAKWLILYAIPGIPLGIAILLYGNEMWIKVSLGILIVVYALYSLFASNLLHLKEDSKVWLFICGLLSGVLGGAYGLNGPPLVVYGNMRRWTAKHFRATLQAYFLPASLLGFIGYAYKGLIQTEVMEYFGWSLITTIPAIFLGRFLNKSLKDDSFYKYAYMGLVVVGVVLVYSAAG